MKINHLCKIIFKAQLYLSLSTIMCLVAIPQSLAQTTENENKSSIIFVPAAKQPEPPDKGTPESNEGAGSRGNCPYEANTLPPTSLVGNHNLTTTLSGHPSFWVYVPYSTEQVYKAEFALQDEDQDLYRDSIELPTNAPGIIEIKLPSTVSPLKIGQQYRWYFELSCSEVMNVENLSSSDVLTGVVKRMPPSSSLNYDLKMAQTPLERVEVFSKYGIWHETLAQLIQLRQAEPENNSHRNLWQKILSQPNVGLTNVAQKLILGTVKFQTLSFQKVEN